MATETTPRIPIYARRTMGATRDTRGMPIATLAESGNFNAGTSNAEGYTPGRGLSVSEIMRRRENRPAAYDTATGRATPVGTRLFVPGYNTSGVGPGTAGYRGSYRAGGYNYGEGTRRPSARTAGEFYAQRDFYEGNPLDRMSNESEVGTAAPESPPSPIDAWSDRTTFGPKASTVAPATNVYNENPNAPSPPVENLTPKQRYNDISARMEALNREASAAFKDQQQFEEAKFVQPKVQGLEELSMVGGMPISPGGRGIRGTYGRGMLNTEPVAKSFTVDTEDGDKMRFNNLSDASRESSAATARLRQASFPSQRERGIRTQMRNRLGI